MKAQHSLLLLMFGSVLMSGTVVHAGEPAWWTQKKAECGISMSYNDWVSRGSPCPGRNSGGGTGSGSLQQQLLNTFIKGIFSPSTSGSSGGDTTPQSSTNDAWQAEQRRQSEARAAELRRQAEEEAARQQAEQNRKTDEARDRLLGNGSDQNGLSLMNVESKGNLELMKTTDDTASGIGLIIDGESEHSADKQKKGKTTLGYTKGFEHASQCYSQNSSVCNGASAEEQGTCISDYREGYKTGDKIRAATMKEAYKAGEQDAATNNDKGFNDPRAQGPCRTQWIKSYNSGHFQGAQKKAQR